MTFNAGDEISACQQASSPHNSHPIPRHCPACVTMKLENTEGGEKNGWRQIFHQGAHLNSTKLSPKRYLFYRITGVFFCVCVYGIAEKEGFFIFGVDVFRTEHSTLSPLSPPVFAFCSNLIRRQRGLQTFITQDPKSIEFSIRDKRDRVPMSSHAMPQNTREQSSRYKAYRSLHSSR